MLKMQVPATNFLSSTKAIILVFLLKMKLTLTQTPNQPPN